MSPPAPMPASHHGAYRPDIDGLRAIAVVSVILFHLDVPGFAGGFVGVDVFFVISGFLISRNILLDLQQERFSFARFYERRARRLFPALFATLAATLLAGALFFSPDHLVALGRSLAAAVVSGSNILFWQSAGYFDTSATLKPLLHTWSLSVEEQFYLVWPLAMVHLWRRGGARAIVGFLIVASLLSLIGAEWLRPSDREAVFYLAPFRVVELGIGALAVWLVDRGPRGWGAELLAVVGLAAIGYAVVGFSARTPFPGLYALVPCLGTAALICARDGRYVRRLLSHPVPRVTGLLSYSLYLVHWPILVFALYLTDGALTVGLRALVLLLTVSSAALMYRYVERTFRRAPGKVARLRPAQFALGCVALALALCVTSLHAVTSLGWTWRMPEQLRVALGSKSEVFDRRQAAIRSPTCHMNGSFEAMNYERAGCLTIREGAANFLVIGDSHAADVWMALHAAYPAVNFLQATGAGCLPIASAHRNPASPCRKLLARAKEAVVASARLDGVILAGRWNLRHVDLAVELAEYRERELPVVIFGPIAEFSPDARTIAFRYGKLDGLNDYAQRFVEADRAPIEQRMSRFALAGSAGYVSTTDLFCTDNVCPLVDSRGQLLIADYGHWSVEGGEYFARRLAARYETPFDFFLDDDAP